MDDKQAELLFWDSIKNSENKADFQAYLSRYPNGQFSALAKNRAATVANAAQVAAAPAVRPIGIRKWVGIFKTKGGGIYGFRWCKTSTELKMELTLESGSVKGIVHTNDGQKLQIRGTAAGKKLRAKVIVARGWNMVGSFSNGVVKGRFWNPLNSSSCEGTFKAKLVGVE